MQIIEGKEWFYVILPDRAAGRRNRFTVHKIGKYRKERTQIIGRELPPGFARKLSNRHEEELGHAR